MRRIVIAALALAPSAAVADGTAKPKPTFEHCDKRASIALDTKTAVDRNVTYDVDGELLRVCVDKAVYPYAVRRGHFLLSCVQVGVGSSTSRFCGEGSNYTDYKGYRVNISLRTPRFTDSCEVWMQVEKLPPK